MKSKDIKLITIDHSEYLYLKRKIRTLRRQNNPSQFIISHLSEINRLKDRKDGLKTLISEISKNEKNLVKDAKKSINNIDNNIDRIIKNMILEYL